MGKYVFNANEDVIDHNNIAVSCNSDSVNGDNPCTLYFMWILMMEKPHALNKNL